MATRDPLLLKSIVAKASIGAESERWQVVEQPQIAKPGGEVSEASGFLLIDSATGADAAAKCNECRR